MVIESRTIVGAVAALAIVGGGFWLSSALLKSKNDDRGMVEVRQLSEPAWTVEVKELGADDSVQKTAAR
jgi:hypothetical protein